MKKTFFKNSLTITHLIVSLVIMAACIVAGVLYKKNTTISLLIAIGGIACTLVSMWYSFYKKDIYRKVKITDYYIEIVSYFKIGFRIDFKDVKTVGKFSMAVTQTSHEMYFFSTMLYEENKIGGIDKQNTITFDRTHDSEVLFKYICDKYGFEVTEF